MKFATVLVCLAVSLAVASVGRADPAAELRELDRQLAEGRISKSEHDRRWSEIIYAGTRDTGAAHVPRLQLRQPDRLLNEVSIAGSIAAVESTDVGEALYSARAMIGRFVTPNLQLSVGGAYGEATVDDVEHSLVDAFAVADYHFKTTGVFVPYAGGGAGWTHVERDDRSSDDWFWNAHVGIKQYLRGDTALKYEIGYVRYDDIRLGGVCFSLGICALF